MQLIKATIKNINDIVCLESKSFKKCFTIKDIEYELNENPFSNLILAKLEDKIVGYIDYWITFDSSTITRICVLEEFRRKKIASSLIEYMFKDIKVKGVNFITLEVRKSNLAAIKFYEKYGFNLITTKEQYYDNKEDALYFVKGL